MRRTMVILGFWATLLPAEALAGGGNWMEWDRSHHLSGQRVEGLAAIFSKSAAFSEGPFFAYLSRFPKDGEWPEPPRLPKDARIIAPIRLLGPGALRDGSHAHIRAFVSFPAPPAPGSYEVSFCNRPCTRRLPDVDSTFLRVFASEVEARLVPKMMRLRQRVDRLKEIANRALSRVETHRQFEAERRGDLTSRVEGLERSVQAMRAKASEEGSTPLLPVAMSALAAVAYLLGRRTRREGGTAGDVDAELKEMTLVEPSREGEVSRSL